MIALGGETRTVEIVIANASFEDCCFIEGVCGFFTDPKYGELMQEVREGKRSIHYAPGNGRAQARFVFRPN